ncbi:MAG: hypothetical protein Q8P67_17940 [archaeon]|nr:hypothetical protein [archaeon]
MARRFSRRDLMLRARLASLSIFSRNLSAACSSLSIVSNSSRLASPVNATAFRRRL